MFASCLIIVLAGYVGLCVAQVPGICTAYYNNGNAGQHTNYGCCTNGGKYGGKVDNCTTNQHNCDLRWDTEGNAYYTCST
jgi:hypothetical protein